MKLVVTLQQLLKEDFKRQGSHGLIVWYDPGGTMQSLLASAAPQDIRLKQFEGSYLALRFQVENEDPHLSQRWLIYVPEPSRKESWLRDWELIGAHWEMDLLDLLHRYADLPITPQSKSLLRSHPQNAHLLAQRWSDLMENQAVNLDNISKALLAMALGLSGWQTEQAVFELLRSDDLKERLSPNGLWETFCQILWEFGAWEGDPPAREDVLRKRFQASILLSELIQSYPDISDRFSDVLPGANRRGIFAGMARLWREREDLRSTYLKAAHKVEKEYKLGDLLIPNEELLSVETFSGIDELWRHVAVESVAVDGSNYAEKAAQVHKIAQNRSQYFWARQSKASYWEPIEYAARLYEGCRQAMTQELSSLEDLIHAYTVDGGWWLLDYYALVSAAHAGNLREAERARLLYPAWRVYGEYLHQVNLAFAGAVANTGWQPVQQHFWSQFVTGALRTAVFMVDALRYDLAQQLVTRVRSEGLEVSLKSLKGSLPSITEIGMSALLPGAELGLEVSVANSRLRVRIDDQEVTTREQRVSWLMQKMPQNNKIIRLDQIEQEKYDGVGTLVVLSREVDAFGTFVAEIDPAGLLDLVERLGKGIQYIIEQGFERVFVVTDHGFLYLPPEVSQQGLGHPAPKVCKRRFAIGANPQGCVVKTANEIGLKGEEVFAFPSGSTRFQIQGDTGVFHHGGISLQECILPALEIKPADVYEKIGVVMELSSPITSRIVLVPLKATNVSFFSRPRKVVVEIAGHASPVIEMSSQNQSGVARVEWLGFADSPPAQVTVRLKDVESLQVLEERLVKVEVFL